MASMSIPDPAVQQKKSYTPQEAAQMGLGWADPNNPNYGKPGYVGSTPSAPAAPGAAASTPGSPITTQQQVGGTTASVGGLIAPGTPTTIAQSYQQSLVNKLNGQPISAANPGAAGPAIEANKLAQQRAFERNRNLLAERNAAVNGAPSGGFETQLLGLAQDRGLQEGQFAGNALMQAQQDQNANERAAMGQAASLLSGNAGLAQQQALAELDAALRREGLAQQGQLGNADIALRGRLGEGQLNLGLLTALLGNQQFNQQLGQNAAQFGASLDQNGLLGMLGLF